MNSTEENTMLNLGLKLGENLKKFRLQRELTQEQLADVLGVSAQAVSRWENGTTYPDITLLPTIVSYFEITLDELMGMENWRSEEQLKELLGQLEENGSKGLIYENILLLRDAVKTYPTNYELQFRLVNQLAFCEYKDGRGLSEEEKISFNREAAEIVFYRIAQTVRLLTKQLSSFAISIQVSEKRKRRLNTLRSFQI